MIRPSQRHFATENLDPRLRAGLVGHWIGGGSGLTWLDRSGYGNHGALTGGPIWTLGEGGKRYALKLDGSNDYVSCTAQDSIRPSSITVSMWARLAALTQYMNLASDNANPSSYATGWVFEAGRGTAGNFLPGLFIGGAASAWYVASSVPIQADKWIHFCASFDDASKAMRLYLNGRLVGSGTAGGSISYSTSVPTIGAYRSSIGASPAYHFDGVMDDARLYGRALSAAEIALLAQPSFLPVVPRRWFVGPPPPVTHEITGADSNTPVDTGSVSLEIPLSGTDANTPTDTAALTATPPFRAETLGLASGLRDFRDWAGSSDRQPIALLHVRPVRIISRWSLSSGAVYVSPLEYSYAGSARDVVSVATAGETLRRVETLAQCLATEGTYCYDIDATSASARWDDGVSQWDDGVLRWDQFRGLYVHLTDDASPKNTTVLAFFGVWFSTRSRIDGRPINVPTLGDDALARVAIAAPFAWTTSINITGWDESALGASELRRDLVVCRWQSESAKVQSTGLTGSSLVTVAMGSECVAGARYRLSGSYFVDVDTDDQIYPAIRVYDLTSSTTFTENGRDLSGTGMLRLAKAGGEWRRFTFDFLVPASASIQIAFGAISHTGVSGDGVVWFEDLRLQPVFRYETPEPRLLSSSVPEVQQATSDHIFGGKVIGAARTTFTNADGDPEDTFFTLSVIGGEQRLYSGGAFRDGQMVPFDNFKKSFSGITRRVSASDVEFGCDLEDVRTFYHLTIPLRVYSVIDFPTMDPGIEGGSRPLLFGAKTNITPKRYATHSNTGYGLYEICDVTDCPNGITSIDAIYAYSDEQAARDMDTARRLTLSAGTDYTASISTGRFTIDKDVRFIEIGAENSFLDFSDGSTRQAVLTFGLYTTRTLATAIQTAMNAVSSGITVTYSESTHLWTITKASGTLQLLVQSGAATQSGVWRALGFSQDADLTGSLTYTSDEDLFTGPSQHILRVSATGIRDDSSGTYTGSANAAIVKGPDIIRFFWSAIMGLPPAKIDSTSFAAARVALFSPTLAVYFGEPVSTQEIFEHIEASCMADIVIDGAGDIRFTPYTTTVGATVTTLRDSDIWDWTIEQQTDHVYAGLRVLHSKDPSLGTFYSREDSNAEGAMQFARPDTRDIETYLSSSVDAQNVATLTQKWTLAPRRVAHFSCSGSLLEAKVGDKVRITRSRALSADGTLASRAFRIIAIGYDLNGDCTVSAIDDE